MPKIEPIALAVYLSIDKYSPRIGDFVIWKGWFSTWYGVVNGVNSQDGTISVVFEKTPRLMLTLTSDEMANSVYILKLVDIHRWSKGSIYVSQQTDGRQIWYI